MKQSKPLIGVRNLDQNQNNVMTITKWKNTVLKRDKLCQECGDDNNLIAHHIKSWKDNPSLRYDINNGMALCKKCHKLKHPKKDKKVKQKITHENYENSIFSQTITTKEHGKIYGLLTIIDVKYHQIKGKYYVRCICKCGKEEFFQLGNLRSGNTSNCGCEQNKKASQRMKIVRRKTYVHGGIQGRKKKREYSIWSNIKQRCTNKNHRSFHHYGGRGIIMCDRWINSYLNFIEDMGNAPSDKHEIDRIDVNGIYKKNNCRWATRKEQLNNKRDNKLITYNNITKTYAQWEEELQLPKDSISKRKYQGWNDIKCIITPVNIRSKK